MWMLRPLYLDTEVRVRTQQVIEGVAHKHGWLLSDIDIQEVNSGRVRFVHRSHIRGKDPKSCFDLNTYNTILSPCGE